MKRFVVLLLTALVQISLLAERHTLVMSQLLEVNHVQDASDDDAVSESIANAILTEANVDVKFHNGGTHLWNVNGSALDNGNCGTKYSTAVLTITYKSQYKTYFHYQWANNSYSNHTLYLYIDGVYKSSTNSSSYSGWYRFIEPGEHVIEFRDSIGNSTSTSNYSHIKDIILKEIYPLETAVLSQNSQPLTFQNNYGERPWTIEEGFIQNGNNGASNSSSTFSTTFTIDKPSKFSFEISIPRYNTYTENNSTYSRHTMYLYFNNEYIDYWAAQRDWTCYKYVFEPGTYTVMWKDTIRTKDSYNYFTYLRNIELSSNWIDVELASAGTLGVEVLYKVNVLNDVEMLKIKGTMNSSDWTDIKNMKNLTALDLSEATIENIPDNAFNGLSYLSWVILPEGLKTIGRYAFKGTRLFSIDIPSTVTSIGYFSFANTSLTKVSFNDNSQLAIISDGAFYNCSSLGDIIMPNTVTYVGACAFQGCSSIRNMVFSDALTTIWDYTCSGCTSLQNIHLPINLKTIRYRGFYNTPNLLKVNLPSTVNRIYDYAFCNCGLDSLLLPVTMQYLHQYAFDECKKLKYIELPSYLASGSSSTTYYYVSSDALNSSNTNMYYGYNYNFKDCPAIETVVMRSATPPSITNDPFSNARAKSSITLKVPSFAVVNYKLDNYWYQFGSIIEGDDVDYWRIASSLSLTNNRRMQGKPDIDLYYGGQFTVGGNAPMEVGQFNVYVSEDNPGRLLNTCEAMTADNINSYFSVSSEKWYFITPLHDVDLTNVTVSNNASYVFRYYDGNSRATSGTGNSWRNVDNGKLNAGQGYIFRCNANAVITFPAAASVHAQVFNTNDVTKQLAVYEAAASANKSWNFVGNPYPCYYDIYYMDFTAPITVWTGSTYKAYSIVDDSYALRPMQAFFVQKPDEVDNIIFHKEGRQLTSDINHAAGARAFRTPASSDRHFFELQLLGDEMTDETRIVVNEKASLDYEISCDASKFMSFETAVPQMFTLDNNGNGYAINERPLSDGTVRLAYYVGQSGFYTISATRTDGNIYLYDAQTNKTVNLNEQDYTFHSDVTNSTNTTRFVLSLTINNGGEVTGIDSLTLNHSLKGEVSIYTLSGQRVSSASKGVYVKDGRKVVNK